MKKIILLSAVILLSGMLRSQSPITLGNTNMPASGDTLRYSNAQLNSVGNYTQTGANYTWNFSSLVPTGQGIRNFKAALLTPYAFFFLGLNEYGEKLADTLGSGPIVMTNYYDFYKKQTSPITAFIADGVGLTYSSIPVPSYYTDKDELYVFPMTYPQYDSTTFKFTTAASSLIPVQYSKAGHRITVVDGWGSITTPFGTANCLRLVTTQYSQDSIKNNIIPFPFGIQNYQRSYQWLTSSSKIPFLEVTGNLVGNNFTVTQVRYRDIIRYITGIKEGEDISGMQLYPNPVREKLYLKSTGTINKMEIFNLNGQLLRSGLPELAQNGTVSINVCDLAAGVYVISIDHLANRSYFKFIKE